MQPSGLDPLPKALQMPRVGLVIADDLSLRKRIEAELILRDLAPRFEQRIVLSATPHHGPGRGFTALLELLDPSRFTCGVPFDQPS